jgi:hypothetical protein
MRQRFAFEPEAFEFSSEEDRAWMGEANHRPAQVARRRDWLSRAVSSNRRFARSLGWQQHYDRIAQQLLGFRDFTPDEQNFARGVARWQQAQGLPASGVIGLRTWARMRGFLALTGNPQFRGIVPVNVPALKDNIVRLAKQEWEKWGRGTIKESDERLRPVLQDYWLVGTGTRFSEPGWWSKHAWSAAFISWIMKKAGAGDAFRYAAAHAVYIKAAKENRLANNANPFKAYRISEIKPQVGDLVCKGRAGSGASYENIHPGHKTHCDIVTAVHPNRLATIGGNVRNSVSKTPVSTNADGYINQPNYFAVIRISAPPPTDSFEVGPSAASFPSSPPATSSSLQGLLESLRSFIEPSASATVRSALNIVRIISLYYGIPWKVCYTILEHEGGVRLFTHPDGVMQTTSGVRRRVIPRIPRALKLALLKLSSDDRTPDNILAGRLLRAFSRQLVVQIATGVQELRESLQKFSGYVGLAFQAYNAGTGWGFYTATVGRHKARPAGLSDVQWENMCRFGASLLHQPVQNLRIGVGVWQCDANIPAWFSHIPVYDQQSGVQLIAFKYLRSITQCIRQQKPTTPCTWKIHRRRESGSGPEVCTKTRPGSLDKLYNPKLLRGDYYEAAKEELIAIQDDGLPLKVVNGRLVKMPLVSSVDREAWT